MAFLMLKMKKEERKYSLMSTLINLRYDKDIEQIKISDKTRKSESISWYGISLHTPNFNVFDALDIRTIHDWLCWCGLTTRQPLWVILCRRGTAFSTILHVRLAKTQISLRICAVCLEFSQGTLWIVKIQSVFMWTAKTLISLLGWTG